MAKRYDNLFEPFIDFGNLYDAFRKAARGKRSKAAAAKFEMNLADELIRLQADLAGQTWRPGAYHSFTIRDPKQRLVSAAPFRDRVVHHALCNVTEWMFENTFIADSYANRAGKGTHAALDKAQAWMRHYPYVLQCDIRQFFPSVDHAVLYAILSRKVVDEAVLRVIRLVVESGEGIHDGEYRTVYFPGDDLLAACRPRGLPIGNLTSQFWANVYLNELDQFVKRKLRCPAYLRYADDFLLFADDKAQLWAWKTAIREFLCGLRLVMHEDSSTVYPTACGVPFLGFRLYPTHRRLKRKNGVNFQRRLRRFHRAYRRGEMSREDVNRRVKGWVAHVAHADTWRLRRSLFAKLPSLCRGR